MVTMHTPSKQGNLCQLKEGTKGKQLPVFEMLPILLNLIQSHVIHMLVGSMISVFINLKADVFLMVVVMTMMTIVRLMMMKKKNILDTVWAHMLKWGEKHKVTSLH